MLDLEPLSTDQLVALSRQLEVAQQYDQLEKVLRRIVALLPGAAEHAVRLGWSLLALNRLADAREVFAKAKGATPAERVNIAFGAGIAAQRSGDAAAAVGMLAVAAKGGVAAANRPLVAAANDIGEFRKGLEATTRLIAQAPLDRDAVMLHARQLAYVGDYGAGAAAIVRLFASKKADSESLELLSQLLTAAQDYAGASNALGQLLRVGFERAEMHALWTHVLVAGFPADEGAGLLNNLIAGDPQNCAAFYQLALNFERRGKLDEAVRLAKLCATLQPDSPLIDGLCGRLELLRGNAVGAGELLQKVWRAIAKEVAAHQRPHAPAPEAPSPSGPLNPVVYIPVEINSRELVSRLLIALFAARAGFTVVILGHTILRQASNLPRGIILNKSLHAMDNILVEEAHRRGHALCVIDEEAFGWTGGAFSLMRTLAPELLPYCAALFAPGQYYVDRIADAVPGAPLVVAGNPRTDLYDERFSTLVSGDAEMLRTTQGRSILVCTNFGGWNSGAHAYATVCSIALRASGAAMESERGQWLQNVYQDSAMAECRNTVALEAAIPVLAKAFPEHKIILRPHPGENAAVWGRLLAGTPNVEVSNKDSLFAQILASDAMVHLAGCGTGLEAALAGRQTVCFNPVADCAYPKLGISSALSPNADDIDALVRLVAEAIDRRTGFRALTSAETALIRTYVHRSDRLVSEAIASHISELFVRSTGAPARSVKSGGFENTLREILRAAKMKAEATAFGNIGLRTKRLTVTKDEVAHTLTALGSCLGLDLRLSVATPADGIFIVRNPAA